MQQILKRHEIVQTNTITENVICQICKLSCGLAVGEEKLNARASHPCVGRSAPGVKYTRKKTLQF